MKNPAYEIRSRHSEAFEEAFQQLDLLQTRGLKLSSAYCAAGNDRFVWLLSSCLNGTGP